MIGQKVCQLSASPFHEPTSQHRPHGHARRARLLLRLRDLRRAARRPAGRTRPQRHRLRPQPSHHLRRADLPRHAPGQTAHHRQQIFRYHRPFVPFQPARPAPPLRYRALFHRRQQPGDLDPAAGRAENDHQRRWAGLEAGEMAGFRPKNTSNSPSAWPGRWPTPWSPIRGWCSAITRMFTAFPPPTSPTARNCPNARPARRWRNSGWKRASTCCLSAGWCRRTTPIIWSRPGKGWIRT